MIPAAWSPDGKYLYYGRNPDGIGGYGPKFFDLNRINLATGEVEENILRGIDHISSDASFVVYFDGGGYIKANDLTIEYIDSDKIINPELELDREYTFGSAWQENSDDNQIQFTLYYYTETPMEPDYWDDFIYNIETDTVTKF